MRRIQHASEKLQAIIAWEYHVVATVQLKRELIVQKCLHEFTMLHSFITTVCEDDKVIAVTQVFCDTKRVLHVPIEFIQVDVREYLTRYIPNGDASRTFDSSLSLSLSAPPTATFVV